MAQAELLRMFYERLVPLVAECVQPIADQCLSKGLISESKHEKLLTVKAEKEKARILISAVKTAVETDPESYKLFMHVLDGKLPRVTKVLLTEMSSKLCELQQVNDTTKAVVPFSHQDASQHAVSLTKEIAQQGRSLFGKLEEAIREFERARTSRSQLEKDVESKTHEVEELRKKLEEQKAERDSQRDKTEHRISDCESDISKMKERMSELESIIEEWGMSVKRHKSFIFLEIGEKTKQLVDMVRHEEEHRKEALREKEEQLSRAEMEHTIKLKEKDDELLQAKKEIEKLQQAEETKDLKHRVALQEKDLKIKDLELEAQRKQVAARAQSNSPTYSNEEEVDYFEDSDNDPDHEYRDYDDDYRF